MDLAMNAEDVQEAIAHALVARIDTPQAVMDEVAATLTECTLLLLPAARVTVGHMAKGGVLRSKLSNRLDSIERQADIGLGAEGRYTALARLRVLGQDCQYLMIRYGPGIS